MKKMFLTVVALAFGMMAMATETAYVEITLSGNGGGNCDLRLTEDDTRTAAYESGYDVASMMSLSNSYSVLLYGLVGTQNCEEVATNLLDGLKIGFTTNNVDADYTLTFSNFSGRELKLYDAVVDSVITINGTTPAYNFTATAGRVAVTDRFSIGEPAPAVPSICHRYGKLLVYGSKGMTVKVLNMDGTPTAIADTNITKNIEVEIPLTGLADGQYKVEWNGKTLIIDVQ